MSDYDTERDRLEAICPEMFELIQNVSINCHSFGGNRVLERSIAEWLKGDVDGEEAPRAIAQLNAAIKHLPVTFDHLSDMANYVLDSNEDARQMLLTLRDGLQAGVDARLERNA